MRNKDDQIIYLANEFHLVTRTHLAQLTGRNPKSLNESLRRLVRHKQLYCKKRGIYEPYVYATYDIRKREQFTHDLGISDVHYALYKTGRLIEWRQSKEKRKGEINEDAIFSLSVPLTDRVGRIKYYLEYDTGTEPLWQIDERFARYRILRRESKEPFNVLFVCFEEDRSTRFAIRVQKFLDKDKPSSWKLFLFATLQDILSNTQEPICRIAFDEAKHSVTPALLKEK